MTDVYCVLGEDKSDFATLKVLIRRLANNHGIQVKGRGFGGHAKLLKDGGEFLTSMANTGCTKFIVIHDADQKPANEIKQELVRKIVKPSGVQSGICLLVPVQEIESWLLADLAAANKIFSGWTPKSVETPESLNNPKEHLEKLSQIGCRPRYQHATHNEQLAKHICLKTVAERCPSFKPLHDLVIHGKANYPFNLSPQ